MEEYKVLSLRVQLLEQELKQLKLMVKTLTKEKPQIVPEQSDDDPILNIEEAHKLLRLPPHTIYLKARSGEIPSFKISKQYKFKRSELLQWKQMQSLSKRQDVDDYVNRYIQGKSLNS